MGSIVDVNLEEKAQNRQGWAPNHDEGDIKEVFLNFGFPGVNEFPGSTNGIQFLKPSAPPLTQPIEGGKDLCNEHHGCGEQKRCHCSNSLDLQADKTYQLIITNLGVGKGWSHPIHMHGHSFHVVKTGFPTYDSKTGVLMEDNLDINCGGNVSAISSFCNNAAWADRSWSGNQVPGLQLKWAPRKDTIMIPTGGYAVIRFKADNPGLWFMHCHIELHNLGGMAMMLNESFELQPSPPKGFPKCGDFHLYDAEKTEAISDEDDDQDDNSNSNTNGAQNTDDDGECVDKDIFWPIVGCLIGIIALQFIVFLCLCLRKTLGKGDLASGKYTTGEKHNAGFNET